MKELGIDKELIQGVQKIVNRVAMNVIAPIVDRMSLPENLEFWKIYIEHNLKMMSASEYAKRVIELGYDFHGGNVNDDGQFATPNLGQFMPEIIEAFSDFIRSSLQEIPGLEEFFDAARVEGIIAEVRDHLSDDPPNMAAVLDMAAELDLPEGTLDGFMGAMRGFMERLLKRILEDIGYPREQIEQTVASMAYAMGALSDAEYMKAVGGAFGGGADQGALDAFLNTSYDFEGRFDYVGHDIF
jgi:hypothetical protein